MGSLAHYMQELSREGFAIADFIHEGNGIIWELAHARQARRRTRDGCWSKSRPKEATSWRDGSARDPAFARGNAAGLRRRRRRAVQADRPKCQSGSTLPIAFDL